jgi:hypothetical protein
MLIVDDKLISDDVVEEHFMCNLEACKGACCHEGDYGAPLTDEERSILEDEYAAIRPFLTQRGRNEIEAQGLYEYIEESDEWATTCINNQACVYMTRTPEGVAACGIEQAYRAGATSFKKPISCELYPIRVESDPDAGFEALNYDRWDICAAACSKGKARQMPVYKFVKDAIIRKWGQDFYDQLDAAAEYKKQSAKKQG